MDLLLSAPEMAELFIQAPATKGDGGFQSLLVKLQEKCDRTTGTIRLSTDDRRRIKMYAFKYNKGGWENRLIATFGRHLGPNLDRES